jgi:hypothetical protein
VHPTRQIASARSRKTAAFEQIRHRSDERLAPTSFAGLFSVFLTAFVMDAALADMAVLAAITNGKYHSLTEYRKRSIQGFFYLVRIVSINSVAR